MIDPKELRIGNTVWDWDGEEVAVTAYLLGLIEEEPKNYSPIHLTPEWLERFKFDKHESRAVLTPDYYSRSISYNGNYKVLSITIQEGNQYVYIREESEMVEQKNDRLCDSIICIFNGDIHGKLYVHWLQNTWKALTGEEL